MNYPNCYSEKRKEQDCLNKKPWMHEVESIDGKITSIPFDCVFVRGKGGTAFGVWNDEKCYYILDDGDFFEPKKVDLPGDKVNYFNLSLITNFLSDHFESGS